MNELEASDLRHKIEQFEEVLLQAPQVEFPIKHYFAQGLYAREIFIPKDHFLTGRVHKFSHINVISKGDITVLTDDGMKRIQAPCTIISKPGTKRAGYTHEDTIWTTFHATPETDTEKVEDALTLRSVEDYIKFIEKEEFGNKLIGE